MNIEKEINDVLQNAGVQINESVFLDPEENEKWQS